jgi:hypothetical protein
MKFHTEQMLLGSFDTNNYIIVENWNAKIFSFYYYFNGRKIKNLLSYFRIFYFEHEILKIS